MPRLTREHVEGASDVAGCNTGRRQRDDDEMSVASAASTFSAVSFHPTTHAATRQTERDIESSEIKRAKAQGRISLAIRFAVDETKEAAETDAHDWGVKLTEVFEGLQIGDTQIRGTPGNRRIEVQIRGSEKLARRIKEWLKDNSYFADPRRVLYVLRQHSRGPQEELVVVEGPLASGVVGVITVFRRDNTGSEKRTENAAIILYNGVFFDLLRGNADEQALEAAFREQVCPEQLEPSGPVIWLLDSSPAMGQMQSRCCGCTCTDAQREEREYSNFDGSDKVGLQHDSQKPSNDLASLHALPRSALVAPRLV
jgi:hypothetical protein